jgi:tripartite-type tricarboxylate transporter receptor subunit TctC
MNKRNFLATTLACLATCATGVAHAQAYPVKPIRLIVPFAAGGPADVVAREVGLKLGEELGQTVVVENSGGGHGVPAMNAVGRAPADGHILLMAASGNVTIQPLTMKSSADALALLQPVSLVANSPHVLVVTSKIPVTTVAELIAYAKKNPGKVNFGSAGTGGVSHLGMEMFKALTRTDVHHIPYKGTSQTIVDLSAGTIQALFSSMPSLKPLIEKGSIRALGMTGPSKGTDASSLPQLSATVPGMEYTTWYGLYAPVGTPASTVTKLNTALRKVLTDPELLAKLTPQGVDLVASSPQELGALTKKDTEKWAKLIKEENLKID